MADEYKKLLNKSMGIGGFKCNCCNWTKCHNRKRSKVLLRKMVRNNLKRKLRKELNEEI